MKKLEYLTDADLDNVSNSHKYRVLQNKINDLVDKFNELLLNLKPSAHEPKENKGYENVELSVEDLERGFAPEDIIKGLGKHNAISNDPNDK